MSHHPINKTEEIKKVILSTGNVNKPYVVRDVVFAAEKIERDLFEKEENPNELMANVIFSLKEQAYAYGASAIINCHFDHTHLVTPEGKAILEVMAYGTVVQYTQSTISG